MESKAFGFNKNWFYYHKDYGIEEDCLCFEDLTEEERYEIMNHIKRDNAPPLCDLYYVRRENSYTQQTMFKE